MYKTEAKPRVVTADGVPVFCGHDEILKIKDLKPNPKNPNQHNAKQIGLLATIIKSNGWRAPITVSKRSGYIVKGHGRRQAAISAGLKEVPVEYQDYATAAEENADLLADNRIAELSDIDNDKLMDMIKDTEFGEMPVELTGFTTEDLADILNEIENSDEEVEDDGADSESDTDEEIPPFTKPNDLWHLGDHRLLCGSATSTEDIDRLMNGDMAQLVHTDPPYGVSFVGSGRGENKFGMIKNDDKTDDALMGLLVPAFKNYMRYTKSDAAFYIWYAFASRREFEDSMTAVGLIPKQQIIWVKNNFVLAHNDYHWIHEPCLYSEKAGQHAKFFGDRSNVTAWTATVRTGKDMATTVKGGVVLTDGEGHKIAISDKTVKGKKMRYIRLDENKSVFLYNEPANGTVWEFAKESHPIHPTQKPVEIPAKAILNSSEAGDVVLDFFGGSGSTLIACEMTGRKCRSTELDPKYCDAIVKRYAEIAPTGTITCERDGQEYSYSEIQAMYQQEHPDVMID